MTLQCNKDRLSRTAIKVSLNKLAGASTYGAMEQQAMVALRMAVLEKINCNIKTLCFSVPTRVPLFCKKLMNNWGFMLSKV